MLHNTTTLHRIKQQTAFMGRENRMLNYSMKEFKTDWLWTKYVGRGAGKWLGRGSWIFGGPLWWKLAKLGGKGIGYGAKGVEWGFETGAEMAKGVKDMTARPMWTLGGAVASDIKRTGFWDVPKASLMTLIKTPIAIAKTPINLMRGVRDAVTANFSDLSGNFFDFKPLATLNSTRKMVQGIIGNSVSYTMKPIIEPTLELGKQIGLAKYQYVEGTRQAIDQVVEGARRIKNAPALATKNVNTSVGIREQISNEKLRAKVEAREAELAEIGITPNKKATSSGKSEEKAVA